MIANPSLVPGSQRMWTPQSSQDLGVRAQGTDAQKWMRLEVLRKARHPQKVVQGGGKGLGGGGGRPGVIPELLADFAKRIKRPVEAMQGAAS